MKKLLSVILVIALSFGFAPYSVFGETAKTIGDLDLESSIKKEQKEKYVEGEALILLEEDADVDTDDSDKNIKKSLSLPGDVSVEDTFSFNDIPETETRVLTTEDDFEEGPDVVKVSSDDYSTETLIKKLEKLPDIKYAEPNYKRSTSSISSVNDYFDYQWGLKNTGQNGGKEGSDMNLDNIWNATNSGTDKSDTIVAVIDTGVDYNHPDLKDRMWQNNHTGRLAGKNGYNFVAETTDPMDDDGHGTHVSGIIAGAGGDDNGISGVDKGVKIMALKALDEDGDGYDEDLLRAYEYIDKALSLGYKVKAVNNSWGSEGNSNIFKAIIETVGAKGCVSVCAAGNDGMSVDGFDYFPAGIDSPYVVSVAASNEKGELADFSSYGKKSVDIAAPGSSILSSVSYDVYNPTIYDSGTREELSAVYNGFESDDDLKGVKWQNWVDDNWDSSVDSSTSSTTSIELNKDDFFGKPESSESSLKWTIEDYDEDGVYNLYIPYKTSKSKVPTQMSAAIKIIKGLAGSEDDLNMGFIVVTDTKLESDGKLPEIYNDVNTIPEDNMVTYTGAAESMNYWDNLNEEIVDTTRNGVERALVFTYITNSENTDHEILFDDIGVSKGGDSTDQLGKYAFYSGTSMAAPMVCGSLALLSEGTTGYSPEQLAMEIGSMTNGSSLDNKIASGGIIDMSEYKTARPHILNAKISGGNVIINGVEFGDKKGEVIVNNTSIPSDKIIWKKNSITIPSANVKNKIVEFKVITNSKKTAKAEIYVVSGKSTYQNEGSINSTYSGSLTTDGKDLYMSSYGGYLSKQIEIVDYDDDDDFYGMSNGTTTYKTWSSLSPMDPKKMFPDATPSELKSGVVFFDTDLSYLNGYFYTIARLDTGYSSCYALVAYNVAKDKWSRIADRPGMEIKGAVNKDFANVELSSLAAYNGKLYLMGGMNTSSNEVSDKVQVYDLKTKKWSKGPDMRDKRFLGVARQTGDKLVVSLGGNGKKDNSATRPLIFNGKTWSIGEAIDSPMKNSEYYVMTDKDDPDAEEYYDSLMGNPTYYKAIPYYNASVGIAEGGIIYSGLASNSLGDTYTYNVSSNKYTASAYQYNEKTTDEEMIGISVGKKFYVAAVTSLPFDDEDDDDDYYKQSNENEESSKANEGIEDTYLYSMPVKSGLFDVKAKKSKGTISGTGSYLPGQKVTIKAKVKKKYKKKYYLKKMKVGSKSTKKKTYTVNAITKKITVTPSFAKYKTKIKMSKKKATVKAGKSIKLKAKVTKAAHNKKTIKWSVSNKKYASVNKKGKVKLKKAGKGKTVKVYAKAKDGSGVKATCVITIR